MPNRIKLLFLCTGNSCRSQMAEGWTNHLKGQQIIARSAGIEASGVDPLAVQVMAEAGVDISGQKSKTIDTILDHDFDYVVTLCDNARESCPLFPGKAQIVHRGFDDPPALAATAGTHRQVLAHYRRVRDQIKEFVAGLPETLVC